MRKMKPVKVELPALVLMLFGSLFGFSVSADSVLLRPVADTTLLEVFPDNNLGGATFFNSGTTQNGPRNRGLVKFDVAGALPAGAVIQSAELVVEVVRQPVDGFAAASMELRRVLRPWGEGGKVSREVGHPGFGSAAELNEATWNHRFAQTTNTWAAPGGLAGIDFSTNVSSLQVIYDVGGSPYFFPSTTNSVADVQLWLDRPAENFGWMFKVEDEEPRFTARQYASREDPIEERAPALVIGFVAPPRILGVRSEPTRLVFNFEAEAGRSYRVESAMDLGTTNAWATQQTFAPAPTNSTVSITNALNSLARFYRLSTDPR